MYAGRIVEIGPAAELLARPRHPYTRGLLASIPDHAAPRRLRGIPGVAVGVGERPRRLRVRAALPAADRASATARAAARRRGRRPATPCAASSGSARRRSCVEQPLPPARRSRRARRCSTVEGLRAGYGSGADETAVAADGRVVRRSPRGECLALVGESGSRQDDDRALRRRPARAVGAAASLLDGEPPRGPAAGAARARRAAGSRSSSRTRTTRSTRACASPTRSRGPRACCAACRGATRRPRSATCSSGCGCPARLASRFPAELSGGERQRVAIARALAARARPAGLRRDHLARSTCRSRRRCSTCSRSCAHELGLALLFITHDLGVVASIADRVLVLEHGQVREQVPVRDVLDRPSDEYTRRLLEAAPRIGAA